MLPHAVPASPFTARPATVADTLVAAMLAGGHVEHDPETGEPRLTESGKRLVEHMKAGATPDVLGHGPRC